MRLKASFLVIAVALSAACTENSVTLDREHLALGTWGGVNAGVLVYDTIAHVHVGCTFGNFAGPVDLDVFGRFNVSGSFILRAYPVLIGPELPAQFTGAVQAKQLTITVTVNDTVEKKVVVLGPITVTFAQDPQMGPCPICRMPDDYAGLITMAQTMESSIARFKKANIVMRR